MSVKDRHVIVTGGGSGVGAAVAKAFADAGAKLTLLGRREMPLKAMHLPYELCDVTDAEAVKQAVGAARAARGPVSVVIANAGQAHSAPFAKMTTEDFNAMLSVNLIGVANVWQAALGDMKAGGWGKMIAIASTAGLKGYAYVSAYCAAKHGVIGLTRSLAIELAGAGITVNAICPGYVETPMLARSIANIIEKTGKTEDEARALLLADNPQKRFIEPEEIADTALWLCADAAASVNGHALTLNGGGL